MGKTVKAEATKKKRGRPVGSTKVTKDQDHKDIVMQGRVSRYSAAWAEWFTDTMIDEGLEVKTLCEKYPDKCPSFRTVYRWQERNEEFDKKVTQAREYMVLGWTAELDQLAREETPRGVSRDEVLAYNNDKRAKIDVLKFKIAKVAPMLTEKYKATVKTSAVDIAKAAAPTIVIQSYSKRAEDVDNEDRPPR